MPPIPSRPPTLLLSVVLLLSAGSPHSHLSAQSSEPSQTSEAPANNFRDRPDFQKASEAARVADRPLNDRLALWLKANDLADHRCMECFRGAIDAQFRLHAWKDAVATSKQMDAVATEPSDRDYAKASIGRALVHPEVGGTALDRYREAETYLRAALGLERSQRVLFVDGEVLAALGRDRESKEAFELYARNATEADKGRERALAFAADPRGAARALEQPSDGQSAATPTAEVAKAATPPPAYEADAKFQRALAQAKSSRQGYQERIDNWKYANKVAHGACVPCLHQMITLETWIGSWKDVINTSQQLEAATTDPQERLFAEFQRGESLLHANYGSPKPEQLAQADATFRDVLVKSPTQHSVLFEEGRVLALQNRDDEARAMFSRYVEAVPASDRLRTRAERFADDPHLATLPLAPAFRLVTSEGEEMQLDEMNGKVVLLDFWATWCGPCKETLPEITRVAQEYAHDPMFVVISISWDNDVAAWKSFIEKNKMSWPQYRDADRSLSSIYGVQAIPHFFTIDTNGALRAEQVGSQANVRSVVHDLLKKAHKAGDARARATGQTAGQ